MAIIELVISLVAPQGDVGCRHLTGAPTDFATDNIHEWVGRGPTTPAESGVFLVFPLDAIADPARATVLRAKLTLAHLFNPAVQGGVGKYRVGQLLEDGRWDVRRGFFEGLGIDEYFDTEDFPWPTNSGTDAINPGVLPFDAFLGTVEYTAADHLASTGTILGDAAYSPDHVVPLGALIDVLLFQGKTDVAYVLDPFELPGSGNERFSLAMADLAPGAGTTLTIEYDDGNEHPVEAKRETLTERVEANALLLGERVTSSGETLVERVSAGATLGERVEASATLRERVSAHRIRLKGT